MNKNTTIPASMIDRTTITETSLLPCIKVSATASSLQKALSGNKNVKTAMNKKESNAFMISQVDVFS